MFEKVFKVRRRQFGLNIFGQISEGSVLSMDAINTIDGVAATRKVACQPAPNEPSYTSDKDFIQNAPLQHLIATNEYKRPGVWSRRDTRLMRKLLRLLLQGRKSAKSKRVKRRPSRFEIVN